MRKQNSSPPNRACRSRVSLPRSSARKSSERIWSERIRATRSMILSPTAWPSVSLYHLKLGDVDDADAAPADALLDGEERFEPLHEPVEVQQLRLRVAVRLLGELGDDLLEVARDVADGHVLVGQLPLNARHLLGEPFRQRPDRLVLRLFVQLPLARDQALDGVEQLRLPLLVEPEVLPHPRAQIGRRPGGLGTGLNIPDRVDVVVGR